MKLSDDELERAIDAYYEAHKKAGGWLVPDRKRRKDIERKAMRAALATLKDKT